MSETPVTSDIDNLQLKRVYLKHAQFDMSDGATKWQSTQTDDDQLRIRFNLRNHSLQLAAQLYEVVLQLKVDCVHGQQLVYQAEVHQAGVFELEGATVDKRAALNTRCPRALLPLAKRVADALVQSGGFSPFELPPVDFDAEHARHLHKSTGSDPLLELQKFWEALVRLQNAGTASARTTDFCSIHAKSLAVAQLSRDVLPAADQVLTQSPSQPETLEMLSAVYTMNNVHHRAVEVYRLAVLANPGDARAHYNLATSLMFTGQLAEAEQEITTCIKRQPTFWDAYTVLCQVRRQGAQHNDIDSLQSLLRDHGSQTLACERLHMALAIEYEDVGDYKHAFKHLAEGNAVGKVRRRYNIGPDEAVFDALMRQAPTVQPITSGFDTREPIFVFGMPRSGTTLVERILSSHPQVTAAGELKQFGMLLKCLSGSRTAGLFDADTIARSRNLDWEALGRQYLASTRPLSGQTPHFIDKFPHHFLYAGYIANALPRAKIICLRRDPMDTCLGNFRQVFSENSPFHGYACDLQDTARYYALFDRLMAHWQHLFPGRIKEMSYESLVEGQESSTRSLLEFCELRWDPACLNFEANRAPVSTASATQVRSPIYHHAIQRWKRYAEQLAPLREALIHEGIDIPAP